MADLISLNPTTRLPFLAQGRLMTETGVAVSTADRTG